MKIRSKRFHNLPEQIMRARLTGIKKDPDLSHIRQTIDDLDYTINMMRGELRSKDAEVCDLIVEFNEHARAIQQTFYKKTALSLFYGFLFGTGMYLAVFILENLV